MSCGCIPITCGIRAISELVEDGESGFLIKVKTDANNNPRKYVSSSMWKDVESQLVNILSQLKTDWLGQYMNLSKGARHSISTRHDPEVHRSELLKLYHRALE